MRRFFPVLMLLGVVAGVSGKSSNMRGSPVTAKLDQPRFISRPQSLHQHEGHAPRTAGLTIPLAIDGAVNPSAISDDQAYGHFLSAMASLGSAKARDTALKSVGLPLADRAVFVSALNPLTVELEAIAEQRKSGGSFESLRQRQQLALETTRRQVQSTLSRQGSTNLSKYVDTQVKPRIKVYRGTISTVGE